MGRPRGSGVLPVLLLVLCAPAANADSAIEIIGKLKVFRDASMGVLETAATTMTLEGDEAEAAQVRKWSDNWLSILGVSTGLTGLAKDFVVNYLGRSAYHDINGPLISAIKEAASAFPERPSDIDEDITNAIRQRIIVVCREGMQVFTSGGALHQMLSELRAILKTTSTPHFTQGLKSNSQVKTLFHYVSGPKPDATEEL